MIWADTLIYDTAVYTYAVYQFASSASVARAAAGHSAYCMRNVYRKLGQSEAAPSGGCASARGDADQKSPKGEDTPRSTISILASLGLLATARITHMSGGPR